jgi:hypothetical protein
MLKTFLLFWDGVGIVCSEDKTPEPEIYSNPILAANGGDRIDVLTGER